MSTEKYNVIDDVAEGLKEESRPEVTIKFGKGLVGEPFTSKAGKELVEVSIPNADSKDTRSWETFVTSPKMIHDNQFGKGVWMKLPEDGKTTLSRSVKTGIDEAGKTVWGKETREISNQELKTLIALGFQGFLIMICVGIYAVLIQNIAFTEDIIASIWGVLGYTVLLCFTLFKTGTLAQSVFSAH